MNLPSVPNELTDPERRALAEARDVLEHPGLAARITDLIGMPVERSLQMLPESVSQSIDQAVGQALRKALQAAVRTLGDATDREPRLWTHRVMAGLTGAAGGAFGLPALAVELPVSTLLILRSVADIARSHGESLEDLDARLACLEVFALGGGRAGEATDVGYFAVRAGLAKHVTDAGKFLAGRSLTDPLAPPLLQLVNKIGHRFGIAVTQKVAAQAVPIIGAAGGALINSFFIDHYQDIARAHFTVRQLERKYGREPVRLAYQQVGDSQEGREAAERE